MVEVDPIQPDRFTTLKRIIEDDKHRLVVSFGGGAVPGIAGNLALAYLLEQLDLKDKVEEIWGTSAGAVVAGGWASGSSAQEILDVVISLRGRGTVDVAWFKLARALFMRPFGRPLPGGIVHGHRFKDAIGRGLTARRIEDCPIPTRLIAVHDDGSMRKKVFRKGDLQQCIFASMAIPGVVIPEPVEEGSEQTFYDGGLLEKTPLISPVADHSRLGDGRKLLLLGTHFDNEVNKIPAQGFIARFLQTIYAMEDVCWQYQLNEVRKRDDVTLMLLNPKLEDGSLFDFSMVEHNFRESYRAYADVLQNAKLPLTFGVQ